MLEDLETWKHWFEQNVLQFTRIYPRHRVVASPKVMPSTCKTFPKPTKTVTKAKKYLKRPICFLATYRQWRRAAAVTTAKHVRCRSRAAGSLMGKRLLKFHVTPTCRLKPTRAKQPQQTSLVPWRTSRQHLWNFSFARFRFQFEFNSLLWGRVEFW